MPGLHSRLGYSSRLLVRCERDELRTNVDFQLSCENRQGKIFETFSFLLTRDWFTDMPLRALRQDENRSKMWKTRQMYPSHSRSSLVSCCLNENVNQALHLWYILQRCHWFHVAFSMSQAYITTVKLVNYGTCINLKIVYCGRKIRSRHLLW